MRYQPPEPIDQRMLGPLAKGLEGRWADLELSVDAASIRIPNEGFAAGMVAVAIA